MTDEEWGELVERFGDAIHEVPGLGEAISERQRRGVKNASSMSASCENDLLNSNRFCPNE